MRVIGSQFFTFDAIRLPPDFEDRMASQDVAELAQSIEQVGGVINLPVVRAETMAMLTGRDRAAAFKLAGAAGFEGRLVSCDDDDAELIEEDENFRRRNYSQAQRDAARVRRVVLINRIQARKAEPAVAEPDSAGSEEAEPGDADQPPAPPAPQRKPGRPRNHGIAQAARMSGVTPGTVRRSIRRVKEAAAPPAPPPPAAPLAPPIELHGFPVPLAKLEEIRELMDLLDDGERRAREHLALIGKIEKLKSKVDPQVVVRLRTAAQELIAAYRAARPASLCPWCKSHPVLLEDCPACGGSAYARQQQADNAPKPLKSFDMKRAMVSISGEMKLYGSVTADDGTF